MAQGVFPSPPWSKLVDPEIPVPSAVPIGRFYAKKMQGYNCTQNKAGILTCTIVGHCHTSPHCTYINKTAQFGGAAVGFGLCCGPGLQLAIVRTQIGRNARPPLKWAWCWPAKRELCLRNPATLFSHPRRPPPS